MVKRIDKNELTMYMVTHKPVNFVPAGRTPIFVGGGDNKNNYLRDNTGDNIAEKNPHFCELTAMYWIWKNDKSSKYVSIEHYRRFFMDPAEIIPKVCPPEKIISFLEEEKIVLPDIVTNTISIKEYYQTYHSKDDYENTAQIIHNIYPEYSKDFQTVMLGKSSFGLNMMVVPKSVFDKYCEWLFTILFKLEDITDLSNRSKYQQRAYGFMSERLEYVWLLHNGFNLARIKQLPIYSVVEGKKIYSILKSMKHRLNKKPYDPTKYPVPK